MASRPRPTKRLARAPAPSVESDDILRKIFLLLDSPADLARACVASPSFRRVITDTDFLSSFRALHPPSLLGIFNHVFLPAEPPHPSASAARGLAYSGGAIDFTCKSFLPSPGPWQFCDSREGRVLYFGGPRRHKESCCCFSHHCLDRPLAVCDPVHRRYIVLPAIPEDLAGLVEHGERLHHFSAFLAPPADDENGSNTLSFRVMCLAQFDSKLVLFVFSYLSSGVVGAQQWRAVSFDEWSAMSDDPEDFYHPRRQLLLGRNYVHGRFYWPISRARKVVVLDARENTPKFSTMDCPYHPQVAFVEAAGQQERLAMVTVSAHKYKHVYHLHYAVLRGDDGDRCELEATIDLPLRYCNYGFIGVAGGYLLLEGTPEGRPGICCCFSLDLQTLQLERFCRSKCTFFGLDFYLYVGYPSYLSAPTV